jgi:hypothetical protein
MYFSVVPTPQLLWGWGVIVAQRQLYPNGKSSLFPLSRTLGGRQVRSGRFREEKRIFPLPGGLTPIIPSQICFR